MFRKSLMSTAAAVVLCTFAIAAVPGCTKVEEERATTAQSKPTDESSATTLSQKSTTPPATVVAGGPATQPTEHRREMAQVDQSAAPAPEAETLARMSAGGDVNAPQW